MTLGQYWAQTLRFGTHPGEMGCHCRRAWNLAKRRHHMRLSHDTNKTFPYSLVYLTGSEYPARSLWVRWSTRQPS